jgi:hypothetical protein
LNEDQVELASSIQPTIVVRLEGFTPSGHIPACQKFSGI